MLRMKSDPTFPMEIPDSSAYAAVVLDRMRPGHNGVEIVAALRRANHQVPVLILTAVDQVAARVEGVDAGPTKWAVHRCGGEIGLRGSPGNGSPSFICLKNQQTTD